MKRLILFIAAALVSVATAQAQSRDVVEIAKSILPKEFIVELPATESTTPIEEPVAVEETAVAEETVEVAAQKIAEVAEEVTEVAEEVTEEAIDSPTAVKINVSEIVKAILPAGFYSENSAAKKSESSDLTPIEKIEAYVAEQTDAKVEVIPADVTIVEEEIQTAVEETVEAVQEKSVALVEEAEDVAQEAEESLVVEQPEEVAVAEIEEPLVAEQPEEVVATEVEEPMVAEQPEEFVATEVEEMANNPEVVSVDVADIAKSIFPADFTIEHQSANDKVSSDLTPVEEITAYVESAYSTKTRFLPMRQRVDRNVDNNKFVYKGEVMLGLTASYGKVNSDNSDLMLLLNGIDVGLRSTTIRPFFAYAYRDNLAVGLRLGYEYIKGNLSNIDVNLGLIAEGMEDMNIGNLSLRNETFSWSLFHRHYLGLDRRGIVGVILETELLFKDGTSRFLTGNDVASASFSRNFAAQLNVNPGLGVYIFPQVCVTATVGIGGLRYNNIRQCDALGEVIGRRDQSSLNFKVNILDIQIGIVAHLWNNKK